MIEERKDKSQGKNPDIWANGKNYEGYIGRWGRLVAAKFVDWLGQPEGLRWLDLGCGTGGLSQTILNKAAPAEIAGIDPSKGFITLAREQVGDLRANFVVGDAQSLPFASTYFDVAVSGLVLNFIPDPTLALNEMLRVVKPEGTIAAYVWDYAGEMQMLRVFWDAVVALDPQAASLDEGVHFKLCQPQKLEKLFKEAGLGTVEGQAIEVSTVFRDFNDFWEPFLGGQGPAPAYVATLDEIQKESLRERLRQTLSAGKEGSIHLRARALAVQGRKSD
jgi:SAM-dependent methyltransferase